MIPFSKHVSELNEGGGTELSLLSLFKGTTSRTIYDMPATRPRAMLMVISVASPGLCAALGVLGLATFGTLV